MKRFFGHGDRHVIRGIGGHNNDYQHGTVSNSGYNKHGFQDAVSNFNKSISG